MTVPGAGNDEIGVWDRSKSGNIAGLWGTRRILIGISFGRGLRRRGTRSKAMSVVYGVDRLLFMDRPEANVAVSLSQY